MLVGVASTGIARGEEGMWLADQTANYAAEGDSEGSAAVTLPLGAVAALGSCTASFVSDLGLLLTNHHCLSGSVQHNSSPDRDYWTDGFVARHRSDELPAASGTRIHVIEEWRDVTGELNAGLDGMEETERTKLVDSRGKALVVRCETKPGRRCHIRSYWGGTRHYLEQRLELQDIRLVYAPGAGLGGFGGDSDNWDWPRHSGDFGLYRAYVAPDGSPAPYAAGNIPYRPPTTLKLSAVGVTEGDTIWTVGFPVITNRLTTSAETAFNIGHYEPRWLALLNEYEAQIVGATADNREKELRYATILQNARNYRKKLTGSLTGADAVGVLGRKEAEEKAFRDWIAAEDGRHNLRMPLLAELDAAVEASGPSRLNALRRDILERGQLLKGARALYRWAKEREKPDAERTTGYRDRDRQLLADRLMRIQSRFHLSVDRRLFEAALAEYRKLSPSERSAPFENRLTSIGFDRLYAKTRLGDAKARLAWLDRPAAAFERSDDPFIQLAVALYPDDVAREQATRASTERAKKARDAYLSALFAYKREAGLPAYPDADGTMRVSRGRVEGRIRDGEIWTPFTTVRGLLEKYRGEGDFDAPARLIAAIRQGDFASYTMPGTGELPVNFLSSADITSGNSGSPTLNAKGEIVGIVFDGTMDGVVSDWVYVPDRNRTIHVDIRFMLWVMNKVDGAGHLLKEMAATR